MSPIRRECLPGWRSFASASFQTVRQLPVISVVRICSCTKHGSTVFPNPLSARYRWSRDNYTSISSDTIWIYHVYSGRNATGFTGSIFRPYPAIRNFSGVGKLPWIDGMIMRLKASTLSRTTGTGRLARGSPGRRLEHGHRKPAGIPLDLFYPL